MPSKSERAAANGEADAPTHRLLRRIDDLGRSLSGRDDVVALLGLGSAGAERDRLDEHSDLDFFVIVDYDAKPRYLADIDWLEAACPVAYNFRNDPNGRKALYADGIFVEYAIFTMDELVQLRFTGARVVWQREDAPAGLESCGLPPGGSPYETVEFHLNEALTNLYVGLHRELRGERLAASRLIQSFAVDRLISLLDLTSGDVRHRRDPFEPSRRVELAYGPDALPLADLVPGYNHNREAARAILVWLEARFTVDPVIAEAIGTLLGPEG